MQKILFVTHTGPHPLPAAIIWGSSWEHGAMLWNTAASTIDWQAPWGSWVLWQLSGGSPRRALDSKLWGWVNSWRSGVSLSFLFNLKLGSSSWQTRRNRVDKSFLHTQNAWRMEDELARSKRKRLRGVESAGRQAIWRGSISTQAATSQLPTDRSFPFWGSLWPGRELKQRCVLKRILCFSHLPQMSAFGFCFSIFRF